MSTLSKHDVLNWVHQEKTNLLAEAISVADAFMDAQRHAQRDPDLSQHTYIGTRVRIVGRSLSCEWHKKQIKVFGTKKIISSTHIGMDKKTGRHKFSALKKEPVWVQQLFTISEDRYTSIRTKFSALVQIETLLKTKL